MIPISLFAITFVVLYLPLIFFLFIYVYKGVKYFYAKYYEKKPLQVGLLVELKYLFAILLFIVGASMILMENGLGYYRHKGMVLDKNTTVDGILLPAKSRGNFSLDADGKHFDDVVFDKPYNFHGMMITKIEKTYEDFFRVYVFKDANISGVLCNNFREIDVDAKGMLISCTLDEANVFSGVKMPKGLSIEHYRGEVGYQYDGKKENEILDYSWSVDSVDTQVFNGVSYRDFTLRLNEKLEIVKFKGEVTSVYLNDKEIRELMKKSAEQENESAMEVIDTFVKSNRGGGRDGEN